jgi:TonB family protein
MKLNLLTLALMAVSSFAAPIDTKPAFISRYANPHPAYMDGAIRNDGTVKCRVTVDEAGRMSGLRVISGRTDLVRPALRTVSNWTFAPAIRNGRTVRSELEVEVRFQF